MSKTRTFCSQCAHYHGFLYMGGGSRAWVALREHCCWVEHGYKYNYQTGAKHRVYRNCTEGPLNKYGNCRRWEPKWIIRFLRRLSWL